MEIIINKLIKKYGKKYLAEKRIFGIAEILDNENIIVENINLFYEQLRESIQ